MEILPRFDVLRPASVAAAIADRGRNQASRFVAGGTDLMVNLRHGLGDPETLIDLRHIPELRAIKAAAQGLTIGATVRLAELAAHPEIRQRYPAIATAAAAIGAPAHREAGTVGGNLCLDTRCLFYNRSAWWRAANDFCLKHQGETCHVAPTGKRCHAAFSGDLAPALLVHDAEVEIAGESGRRRVPLGDLYAEDGAAHLRLGRDEFLTHIHLPADPWPAAYAKARTRAAIDFPLAGVAVALRAEAGTVNGLRVALTGTNARPFLLAGVEALEGARIDAAWLDRLGKLVQKQVSPMRTTLLAAQYRRRVASALAQRLARALAETVADNSGAA
jgi:4-hydroxybenzoyl-CoA reductase subunit beta